MSTAGDRVRRIGLLASDVQVRRVAAGRVVARVAGDLWKLQRPSAQVAQQPPRSKVSSAGKPELSIPSIVARGLPGVAGIWAATVIHVRHEPLYGRRPGASGRHPCPAPAHVMGETPIAPAP